MGLPERCSFADFIYTFTPLHPYTLSYNFALIRWYSAS